MNSPSSNTHKWWPIPIWMSVIFLASTDIGSAAHTGSIVMWVLRTISGGRMTLATMEEIHFLTRKSAHLTEYAIFGALLWRALAARADFSGRRLAWASAAALLIAALYACTDEYHQSFVGSRTASLRDVAIDTVGAAVSIAVCGAWQAPRLSRLRQLRRLAPPPDTA
jgi:VanZ family protein